MNLTSFFKLNLFFGVLFLVFYGCNEQKVSSKGLFNMAIETTSRSIASTPHISKKSLIKISEKYNPTQFYLHCLMREKNSHKKCYYKQLHLTLSHLDIKPSDQEFTELENFFSLEKIEESLKHDSLQTQKAINDKLLGLVFKRTEFCKANSKHFLKRCLMQYKNQDSINLANQLQKRFPQINGIEYLYLKDQIESELEAKLEKQHELLTSTL